MASKKELLLIEIRESGARAVKRNIKGVGEAGDKATDQLNKLKMVLAGLVSAKVLRDTIMLADAYANMLNRLRVVTDSTWELKQAMEGVFKMSRVTRTSMEANIDMYARVAINTKTMGLQYKDVLRFAMQLNHAIILSGVTAREAQWGMVQFSQALASNALRGDELRAILEQLPVVTDVIAAHFKVTRGELRELGFQGLITADKIITAFEEAEESLAERFGRRIPTIDQGITVLRSSILKFVGDMDQAVQFTSRFAEVILFAADNMDTFARFALIAGTLIGTVLLKNLILVVAQMKIFSFLSLVAYPLAASLLLAGAALVVFSDKIKIANNSNATLADFMTAFGENVKTTYKAMRDGVADLIGSGDDLHAHYEITFETILLDAASFIDKFLGVFVGAGQVIAKIFQDIPYHAKAGWNGLITGFEYVIDTIIAGFATIGDMFAILMGNIKSALAAMGEATKQLWAGNTSEAKRFADQAAFFVEKAARDGFGSWPELFAKNARIVFKDKAFDGLKFKMEQEGETAAEAFMRGFGQSNMITEGITEMLTRAKKVAGEGGPGKVTPGTLPVTPGESKLYKELSGNISGLKAETEALNSLMYKQLYVSIVRVEKAFSDGNISISERKDKLSSLKTEMLSYVDSLNTLKTLKDRGRITNEEYAASIDAVTARQAALNETFARADVSIDAYNRKLAEIRLASLKTATDVTSGFQRGFLTLGLEISNFADQAEKVVTNAFKSMENALVSFVTTGKVNFKSLVDGMLADLTRLLARQALMGLLKSMAGGVEGGMLSSIAGAFGVTAEGGGIPASGSPTMPDMAGRALGGPVSPDMQYMVGERGPEIFQPAQPGHITPAPPAPAAAPVGDVVVINVTSEEEALAAMGSAEGKRIIRNEIRTSKSGGIN